MHVYAALVPPREVTETLASVVAGVSEPAPAPDPSTRSSAPGRHVARRESRWGKRREAEPVEPPPPPAPRLDLVPAERMHLVVTRFGNLTETDAGRLADAIEREAAEWEPVLLGLAAGVPPADDVPRSPLTVEVDGDLDALQQVIRGVPRIAQGLHLFVDRRAFAPFLTVGTVNDRTTPDYVRAVLDALDPLSAVTWTQSSLALVLNVEPTPEQPGLTLYREVSLGPAPG